MLVELSVMEQRYQAVMEVLGASVPVSEVAERYGVSRQSVHGWLVRYRAEGLAGLADRSHRPHRHPAQVAASVEAVICEMRREHHRWGPRRIVFELAKQQVAVSRSTVYRVLVRNRLVEPVSRRRRRASFRSWERPVPMQLWQLDVTGKVFLDDGTECKLVSGIDDHSRYCVIAAVVRRATGRAVCRAFAAALAQFGVPEEVLTDNGKVFTGKYGRPRPTTEVLFDRICRENGITHRLTGVRSPTTTGKVERWHQTLQDELLFPAGPFASIEEAQGAVDAWRVEYNTLRPHQSLNMATPAQRFVAAVDRELPLVLPPELVAVSATGSGEESVEDALVEERTAPAPLVLIDPDGVDEDDGPYAGTDAVEVDRVVPASGNLMVGGQQIWLGPVLAARPVTIWVDTSSLHVLLDGRRLKTVPSRLSVVELNRLRVSGARPAGPPPATAAVRGLLAATMPVECERVVSASGLVGLARRQVSVGSPLAGRRVTLRFDGQLMHVIVDGRLVRSMPSPVRPEDRRFIQGARLAGTSPGSNDASLIVRRRVSKTGSIMVATQKVQVGLGHARKTVTVTVEDTCLRVHHGDAQLVVVPRTSGKEVKRYKAYGRHNIV